MQQIKRNCTEDGGDYTCQRRIHDRINKITREKRAATAGAVRTYDVDFGVIRVIFPIYLTKFFFDDIVRVARSHYNWYTTSDTFCFV